MIDVAEVRDLCADLADNGPGRSGAYELELRCKAARILPAMLDEVERLRGELDNAKSSLDISRVNVRNVADGYGEALKILADTRSALADAVELAGEAIAQHGPDDYFTAKNQWTERLSALKSKVGP